jgi:phosphate/sulfate permease
MAANGSGLQLAMVHNIALAWVLPLPAARAFFFLFVANRAAKNTRKSNTGL